MILRDRCFQPHWSGEYTETNIDSSWNAKSLSMAPLFSVEADKLSARREPIESSTLAEAFSSQVAGTMQSQLFSSISGTVCIPALLSCSINITNG